MLSTTRTLQGRRQLYRLLAVLMCASMLLSSVAAAPYSPQGQDVPAPAAQVLDDASRVDYHQIVIKFKPETEARLRPEGFVSATGDLSTVEQTLQGLAVNRLFSASEESLETNRVAALAEGDAYTPDLNLYYRVQLAPETTFEEAQAILASVQADPSVELAYMVPIYLPASNAMTIDDYTDQQTYLQDASVNGIDAAYAWTINGGRGDDVQVIDVENGWQIGHEDLPIDSSSLIDSSNSPDRYFLDHGSAVLGIIAARANDPSIGVTGIASKAYLRMVSTVTNGTADAINKAALNSRAGDIIVIPTQALGPIPSEQTCPDGCNCTAFSSVPVEYEPAVYDAIVSATQAGIIVVEAAGNGAMNLDSSLYDDKFNRSNRDSGAILVGAGSLDDLSPVCDANYGKRIDLQGWGEGVVTTGFGDLDDGGGDPNMYYTQNFGGSSSAAAMIAGAAASLQGIAKNRGYLLNPGEMRSILHSTGTAQTIDTSHPIGPLPNLREAIDTKLTEGVNLLTPTDGATVPTLYPTLDWQDYFSASQYHVVVANNSLFSSIALSTLVSNSQYTFGAALVNNRTYYWRVRPKVGDEWQSYSPIFSFTTKAVSVAGVSVLGPSNGGTSTLFQPKFYWKTVSNVDGYEIQIDTESDFSTSSPVENPDTTYYPDPPLDENSRYYWRVRAYVGDLPNRSYSKWSTVRVLYTSLNISAAAPAVISADGTEHSLRPLMNWSNVPLAKAYWVQTSLSSTFATLLRSDTIDMPAGKTVVPSYYRPPTDLPRSKTVYWRVRAKGTYGWSAWLNGDSYKTGNPPGIPALYSPSDKAIAGNYETNIDLIWYKPTLSPTSYDVQVSTNNNFSNLIIDTSVTNPASSDSIRNPHYHITSPTGLEPESIYYWRVRSVNSYGHTSLWSSYRILYTTPPVPAGLEVQAPIDTLRPSFLWDKVDLARSYQIQIARDSDSVANKSTLFTSTRILATFTTPVNPPVASAVTLPRRTKLVWRVRSGGAYGYSAWSNVASFTTPNPPNTPLLVAPSDGVNLNTFTPLLDWNASVRISGNSGANAASYQLQIANETNTSGASFNFTTSTANTAYRIPTDLLPAADRYYWRVRAVNSAGAYSSWSAFRSFVTPSIITGKVTDALTGEPIQYVNIQVDGRTIQTVTDADGIYSIKGLPTGQYSITTSVSGYMRQVQDFATAPGISHDRNIALVPIPASGVIRIALTWDASPTNLDAYLWLPPTYPEVIYKDNIGDVTDSTIGAQFYRADSDGWGPEMIDIASTFEGTYQFGAYMNVASPEQFIYTHGRVTVYDGSKHLGTFTIPNTGVGKWWKVFKLTVEGSNRTITEQNMITSTSPKPAGY